MKPHDIFDAIGNVDETCVMKAKEKKKSHKKLWITASSIAACLALIICLPIMFISMNNMGTDKNNTAGPNEGMLIPDGGNDNEMALEQDNVWIYYIDGNEIVREQQYLPMEPESIFNAWKEKNGIGDDVEFIRVNIDSNGKTTEKDGMVEHQIGNYFVCNLTISKSIENYYDTIDKELLLDSLEQTMTGYSNIEYDEYNLILE